MRKLTLFLFMFCCGFAGKGVAENMLTVPIADATSSRLLLPVTENTLPHTADIIVTSDAAELDADVYYRLLWPSDAKSKFVRLLVIDLPAGAGVSEITLRWQPSQNELRPFWGGLGDVSLIYPDRAWLQQTIMMHPFSVSDQRWYTDAQRLHANYIADDEQMAAHKYPLTRAAHWLYDKPQSFFQLFLMTGDDWAFFQGKRLAEFYAGQVKEDGYFGLRNRNDTKYIMSRGLTYYYLMTGDDEIRDTIARQFNASLDWNPNYEADRGFWTERNQAAALNTAIAYWELTGKPEAKQRIDDIINATYAMTFEPVNGWSLRNCPQHTMQSHEGKGQDRPVCSPWMMALLADGLWRMVLLADDWRAAELVRAFGTFFAEYGAYTKQKKGDTITAPYYLRAFPDHDWIEKNIWTDPQHNCEIAGMLGKSIMLYATPKDAPVAVRDRFKQFASLCRQKLEGIAEKHLKQGRDTAVRLKPPRRFGWMYSSTSELPWMMQIIL